MTRKGPFILLLSLAGWMVFVSGIVLVVSWPNPVHRAVIGMAWGLIVLWIGGCGLTMWYWREFWRRLAARIRLPWGLKFVLGCTVLALVEEAVTTLMTNCAPLFGVPWAKRTSLPLPTISMSCYITALWCFCRCSSAGR